MYLSSSMQTLLKTQILLSVLAFFSSFTNSVQAQSIAPGADGTNTVVTQDGNRIDITGGTLSEDRANLFHSFTQFGLNQEQIANFLSNPNIRNILGRVTGGKASIVNGLIQVTGGNSHLYLMNPAGIVFGANAQLNVPGSFTATTATGIGFGNEWFNGTGINNYAALVGNPNSFAFYVSQPGSIINAGNLAVGNGQNLALVGGNVINTGTLTAPDGNITVESVPGSSKVLISQAGNVLSLEINPTNTSTDSEIIPLTLGQLAANGNVNQATGVTVNSAGEVVLTTGGTIIPTTGGTTIAAGTISTAGETGGQVNLLGNRVGVIGSNINASGNHSGGVVLIGGDYQGKGTIPNAAHTLISSNSTIHADALNSGNGGRVIAWADNSTQFFGNITAKGGSQSGNGGFVEVSGQNNLAFLGNVDTIAPHGNTGMLLLDPTNITVINGPGSFTDLSQVDSLTDPDVGANTIDAALLNSAATNVTLQASNDITFNAPITMTNAGVGLTALANNNINVNANITTNNGSITLTANADNLGAGAVAINNATISTYLPGSNALTNSAAITITGKGADGAAGANGGDGITLNNSNLITVSGAINLMGTGGAGGAGTPGTVGASGANLQQQGGQRGTDGGRGGDGGNGIILTGNSTITSTSGAIALTGTGGAAGAGGAGAGGGPASSIIGSSIGNAQSNPGVTGGAGGAGAGSAGGSGGSLGSGNGGGGAGSQGANLNPINPNPERASGGGGGGGGTGGAGTPGTSSTVTPNSGTAGVTGGAGGGGGGGGGYYNGSQGDSLTFGGGGGGGGGSQGSGGGGGGVGGAESIFGETRSTIDDGIGGVGGFDGFGGFGGDGGDGGASGTTSTLATNGNPGTDGGTGTGFFGREGSGFFAGQDKDGDGGDGTDNGIGGNGGPNKDQLLGGAGGGAGGTGGAGGNGGVGIELTSGYIANATGKLTLTGTGSSGGSGGNGGGGGGGGAGAFSQSFVNNTRFALYGAGGGGGGSGGDGGVGGTGGAGVSGVSSLSPTPPFDPNNPPPFELRTISGIKLSGEGNQTALINTPFPNPAKATVVDQNNQPIPNIAVTFSDLPSTGPSGSLNNPANVINLTNSSGEVSNTVTANGIVGGPYQLFARIPGTNLSPAIFNWTNIDLNKTPPPEPEIPNPPAPLVPLVPDNPPLDVLEPPPEEAPPETLAPPEEPPSEILAPPPEEVVPPPEEAPPTAFTYRGVLSCGFSDDKPPERVEKLLPEIVQYMNGNGGKVSLSLEAGDFQCDEELLALPTNRNLVRHQIRALVAQSIGSEYVSLLNIRFQTAANTLVVIVDVAKSPTPVNLKKH